MRPEWRVTRQTRVRLPAVVMIPVTMGVQLVLARAFFFPPMVRTKLAGLYYHWYPSASFADIQHSTWNQIPSPACPHRPADRCRVSGPGLVVTSISVDRPQGQKSALLGY